MATEWVRVKITRRLWGVPACYLVLCGIVLWLACVVFGPSNRASANNGSGPLGTMTFGKTKAGWQAIDVLSGWDSSDYQRVVQINLRVTQSSQDGIRLLRWLGFVSILERRQVTNGPSYEMIPLASPPLAISDMEFDTVFRPIAADRLADTVGDMGLVRRLRSGRVEASVFWPGVRFDLVHALSLFGLVTAVAGVARALFPTRAERNAPWWLDELACPQCGYSLVGLADPDRCPECGVRLVS